MFEFPFPILKHEGDWWVFGANFDCLSTEFSHTPSDPRTRLHMPRDDGNTDATARHALMLMNRGLPNVHII